MIRDSAISLLAFAAGVGLATLFGAVNLGTALGVGELSFALAVCWLLLRPEPGGPR